MDKLTTQAKRLYSFEVLGVKNYLCPQSIYSFRSLKGALPCEFLIVVFTELSPTRHSLLVKIMASIDILNFTILHIKNQQSFNHLLQEKEKWADFIFCFGTLDNSLAKSNKATSKPSGFFLQLCALEELEGHSPQVKAKKIQVWNQLKKLKSHFI